MKLCLLIFVSVMLGSALSAEPRDSAYVRVISDRSEKIVVTLDLPQGEARSSVKELLMNHYFALNDIYEMRDSLSGVLKSTPSSGLTREGIVSAVDAKLYRHHNAFVYGLMLWLTPDQIEQVKNGLTYNVLNVTYDAHIEMIPTLTELQKRKIYCWLVEAREYAMDAESSNKKHEIFGKYKGRINNYLSKEGYNLTQEREQWYKRIKENKK